MKAVEFEVNESWIDTEKYEKEPDKYLGLIRCIECKKKAWYTISYRYRDIERAACFNAHHLEGCNKATSVLVAEGMENEEHESDKAAANTDILVNLDRTKHTSIEVSTPADKHDDEENNWKPSPQAHPSGKQSSDFPDTRSLRQILSYLVKNPSYGIGKRINIVANSGREIIVGMLHDYLIAVPEIPESVFQQNRIFWGEINNYSEKKDGTLWLNYGGYSEPSLLLEKELKEDIMEAYKLKSLERFKGSHFIMVGWAGTSKSGKIILRTSMPKYINFINYRERLQIETEAEQAIDS